MTSRSLRGRGELSSREKRAYDPRMRLRTVAAWLVPLALAPLTGVAQPRAVEATPTRVSLDVKDADVLDVARLMAEAGGFQLVADPGPACRLTLRLEQAALDAVFQAVLRACGLAAEETGGIVRAAPAARLLAEAEERRRLGEAQRLERPLRTHVLRLSFARAAELAPLLRQHLSPRGEVAWDARTNTLFVTDVE